MSLLLTYRWETLILIEVLLLVCLVSFSVMRYFFDRSKQSMIFLSLFIFLLLVEGGLGFFIYLKTGELDTFQIVVFIFIVYACTFGIFDFMKLDRWMRKVIGSWRGVSLLTEKDRKFYEQQQDQAYVAKKYRRSAMIHLVLFTIGQLLLWKAGTNSFAEMKMYALDWSWIEEGNFEHSPYSSEGTFSLGILWGVIFIIDFIYSWSYTIFKKSDEG